MTEKTYRVTSNAQNEPWEGSIEELLENNDVGTFVTERLRRLSIGERVHLQFPTPFTVERLR